MSSFTSLRMARGSLTTRALRPSTLSSLARVSSACRRERASWMFCTWAVCDLTSPAPRIAAPPMTSEVRTPMPAMAARRRPTVQVTGEFMRVFLLSAGSGGDGAVDVEGDEQGVGELVGAEHEVAGDPGQRVRRWFELLGADVDDGPDAVGEEGHRLPGHPDHHEHRLQRLGTWGEPELLAQVDRGQHLTTQVDQAGEGARGQRDARAREAAEHLLHGVDAHAVRPSLEGEGHQTVAHNASCRAAVGRV